MLNRALKWAVICGGLGFVIGFFGPIIVAPDANQGPLLGIFITGPGGAMLGFILGLVPLEERTRRAILVPLVALGLGALVYYSGPDPVFLGQVLDGEIVACEEPASLLAGAITRWDEAIRRSTGTPRAGWKEDAPVALVRDPGVVVTVRAERWTTLHEGRRWWNEGKRWSIPWRGPEMTQRGYARQWSSCAALPSGTRGLFVAQELQWGDWPPKHAPGLLWLKLLEAMPDAYRSLLPE